MTDQERVSAIKDEIERVRLKTPMTFQKAWGLVRQWRPDLFGVSPGAEPANVALERPGSDFAYKQAIGIINAEKPDEVQIVQGGFYSNIFTGECVVMGTQEP